MAPRDQQTVYGCAFAEQELGDIGPALKHFPAALEMEAPEALGGLACNGLREIAVSSAAVRGT